MLEMYQYLFQLIFKSFLLKVDASTLSLVQLRKKFIIKSA